MFFLVPLLQSVTSFHHSLFKQAVLLGLDMIDDCSNIDMMNDMKYDCHNMRSSFIHKNRTSVQVESLLDTELSALMNTCGGIQVLKQSLKDSLRFRNAGMSGSFISFSSDGGFITKTVWTHEAKVAHRVLPEMVKYILTHPSSLLNRVVAFFKISWSFYHVHITKFIIIIQNLFPNKANDMEIYDIKGCLNRFHLPGVPRGPSEVDFLNRNEVIQFPSNIERDAFIRQLNQDVLFLKNQGLIDYSLLIGIQNHKVVNVGVIDMFTAYGYLQKTARMLSCRRLVFHNPDAYSRRFIDFIEDQTR